MRAAARWCPGTKKEKHDCTRPGAIDAELRVDVKSRYSKSCYIAPPPFFLPGSLTNRSTQTLILPSKRSSPDSSHGIKPFHFFPARWYQAHNWLWQEGKCLVWTVCVFATVYDHENGRIRLLESLPYISILIGLWMRSLRGREHSPVFVIGEVKWSWVKRESWWGEAGSGLDCERN